MRIKTSVLGRENPVQYQSGCWRCVCFPTTSQKRKGLCAVSHHLFTKLSVIPNKTELSIIIFSVSKIKTSFQYSLTPTTLTDVPLKLSFHFRIVLFSSLNYFRELWLPWILPSHFLFLPCILFQSPFIYFPQFPITSHLGHSSLPILLTTVGSGTVSLSAAATSCYHLLSFFCAFLG